MFEADEFDLDDLEELTLRRAVEFAITTEQLGGKLYERLSKKFADDEELSKIFKQLSEDEETHEKQFQALLSKVPKEEPKGYSDQYGILKAWAISQFFSSRDGIRRDLGSIETREDALQRAFELEQASLGFYQTLREILGEEPVLDSIINVEKQHLLAVMKVLMTGEKFRGLAAVSQQS